MEDDIEDENLINNNMLPIDNIVDVYKGAIKIEINNTDKKGSGCFLKFKRNGKIFYCIMTNPHVIKPYMIKKKDNITIKYKNEKKKLNLILDTKERIIKEFYKELDIDITIIEIIEKDNINEKLFISAYINNDMQNEELIGKDIQILHYPKGEGLHLSNGKIWKISENNLFYYDADTEHGSSGAPTFFKGENTAIGIHKGYSHIYKKNVGIFINIIIKKMIEYKKFGEIKKYYKNGNLKYDGEFLNGEYNGKGILFYENGEKKYDGEFLNGEYNGIGSLYENGDVYIGEFKNGKKNGDFYIIKNNQLKKMLI